MKLFYSPAACSLSPHIVLHEVGAKHDLVKVDLKTKATDTGDDLLAANPKGQVPTLVLDDGTVLTESAVIVQFLADHHRAETLLPAAGSLARVRVQEWLNYVTSEMHKGFSPLFNPATPDAYKAMVKETLAKKFVYLDGVLATREFVTGPDFTVADAYLFTVVSWSRFVGIELGEYKNLSAYLARIAARPAVQNAMKMEGLAG